MKRCVSRAAALAERGWRCSQRWGWNSPGCAAVGASAAVRRGAPCSTAPSRAGEERGSAGGTRVPQWERPQADAI